MKFQQILCVSDLSAESRPAERVAFALAHKMNASLVFLTYVHHKTIFMDSQNDASLASPTATAHDESFIAERQQVTKTHAAEILKELNISFPEGKLSAVARLDSEVGAVLDLLDDGQTFDLAVVAKHHRGFWERAIFGSATHGIVNECRLSVLIIPGEVVWNNWQPQGILVGSALNESSAFAEKFALSLGSAAHLPVKLVHVLDPVLIDFDLTVPHMFPVDYAPEKIREEAIKVNLQERTVALKALHEKLSQDYPSCAISCEVIIGDIGETLVQQAQNNAPFNLVLIGSRGLSSVVRFLVGSHTDTIENSCNSPMLIAHK